MLITILYILCFLSILKGAIQYYYYKWKKEKYYLTEGVIVDNYKDETGGLYTGYRHYYPIVEYIDNNRQTVRIRSEYYNPDIPAYEVGTKVGLLVNPDDNTRLLFDDKVDEITAPLIWVSIGVAGLLVCCFFINNLPF